MYKFDPMDFETSFAKAFNVVLNQYKFDPMDFETNHIRKKIYHLHCINLILWILKLILSK